MDDTISFLDLDELNNKDSEQLMSIVGDKSNVLENGYVFETKSSRRNLECAVMEKYPASVIKINKPLFSTLNMEETAFNKEEEEVILTNGPPAPQESFIDTNGICMNNNQESMYNMQYPSSIPYALQNLTPTVIHRGQLYMQNDMSNPVQNGIYSLPNYNFENQMQTHYSCNSSLSTVYNNPYAYVNTSQQTYINKPPLTFPEISQHKGKKLKGKFKTMDTLVPVTNTDISMYNGNTTIPENYMCVYPVNPTFDPNLSSSYMPTYVMPAATTQPYTVDYNIEATAHSYSTQEFCPTTNYPNSHPELLGAIQYSAQLYSQYGYSQFDPQINECDLNNENIQENLNSDQKQNVYVENLSINENHLGTHLPTQAMNEEIFQSKIVVCDVTDKLDNLCLAPFVNGNENITEKVFPEDESIRHTEVNKSSNFIEPIETVPLENGVTNDTPIKIDSSVPIEKKGKHKNRKRKKKHKDLASNSAGESGNNTRCPTPQTNVNIPSTNGKDNLNTELTKISPVQCVPHKMTENIPSTNTNGTAVWGNQKSWSKVFGISQNGIAQPELAISAEPQNNCDAISESKLTHDMVYKEKIAGTIKKFKKHDIQHQLLPRGLINKNIWCYTNCLLQALIACPPFLSIMQLFIKEIPNLATIDSFPFLSSFAKFTTIYTDVTEVMKPIHKGKSPPTNAVETAMPCEPSCIYDLLLTVGSYQFEKLNQQDAHEALNFLLNGLHEEIVDCLGINYMQPDVCEDGDDWHVKGPKGKSCVTRTTPFHRTPFSELFWGELHYMQTANGTNSANVQPFNTLLLDVQSPKVKTLEDAFDQLVSKEEISGYTCSKTKKETTVVKQVLLQVLPKILILHLNRFTYGEGGLLKDNKRVDFDVQLEIRKDLIFNRNRKDNKNERTYTLFAVVKHEGPMATKGHYICEVNHGDNKWLRCDDSNIKSLSLEEVLKYDRSLVPYLLFYQRNDTIRQT